MQLKQRALELGFHLAGICPAVTPTGFERFRDWLAAGYAGQMSYLSDRVTAYEHPRYVLAGVRSIVMLGLRYRTIDPAAAQPGQGRVSCYAWGSVDYHDYVRPRLQALADLVRQHAPASAVRGVVDTAPLLEHEFARLAGLGWTGKNTLLLNREAGSWFFLSALLTDQELIYDEPAATDHCGSCTACLDACPTKAFPQPYVLDATRCISYLTIELRAAIPEPLRAGLGDWLFGCDVCQDVCPWNRPGPREDASPFAPVAEMNPVDLAELFAEDDLSFRRRFRHTPLWRARRRGLLRTAAVLLGNRPAAAAATALVKGLADHEPLVRAASAWALGKYERAVARPALLGRRRRETDPEVLHAIDRALDRLGERAQE